MKRFPGIIMTGVACLMILAMHPGCAALNRNVSPAPESNKKMVDIEKLKKELFEVDKNFADLSIKIGVPDAFDRYISDDCTILRNGAHPFTGRKNIRELLSHEPVGILYWEPYFADIAESGDLGYTLGKYTFTYESENGDTKTSYGYYITIWKKQPDGSWKVVFDTGNQSPPHEQTEN